MINNKRKPLLTVLLLAFLTVLAGSASAKDVPKVTIEELKAMLGRPDLIVIDVRIERDWKASRQKITGAVWEDFMDVETWAKKYPKDKTIVLYCD